MTQKEFEDTMFRKVLLLVVAVILAILLAVKLGTLLCKTNF